MNLIKTGLAGVALAGAISFSVLRPVPISARTMVVGDDYNSPSWQAPRGCDKDLPQATPMVAPEVRRQPTEGRRMSR